MRDPAAPRRGPREEGPDFCGGRQDVVPVRVCYAPYDLVDFVEPFDVFYFPDGTKICGAIEPD